MLSPPGLGSGSEVQGRGCAAQGYGGHHQSAYGDEGRSHTHGAGASPFVLPHGQGGQEPLRRYRVASSGLFHDFPQLRLGAVVTTEE